MRLRQIGVFSSIILLGQFAAQAAITIDFSSAPAGNYSSYSEQGVTFTAFVSGGNQLTSDLYGPTPNGTRGIHSVLRNGQFSDIKALIAGGASRVSIDLGDFTSDDGEFYYIEGYNSTGNGYYFDVFKPEPGDSGMHTLSIEGTDPPIAYVVFGSTGPNGSSVFADNLSYIPLPEPASVALLIAGAMVAGGRWRRRHG